jgi:hypothetical protein
MCEVSCLSTVEACTSAVVNITFCGICHIVSGLPIVIVLIEGSSHATPVQIHGYWYMLD